MASPNPSLEDCETSQVRSILVDSTDLSMPWYKQSPGPRLDPTTRTFFESYTGVAPQDLDSHIISIVIIPTFLSMPLLSALLIDIGSPQRSKAWRIRPYPCIGSFSFLQSVLRNLPAYGTIILPALRSGDAAFVDLGCCFGQELRWLAADGVPSSCMVGVDVLPDFWELGLEIFRDRHKMQGRFTCGDIVFDDNAESRALIGKVDVLFAGNFFHLFTWEKQVLAVARVVSWSKGVGSVVCGVMIGSVRPRALLSGWGEGGWGKERRSEQFWHDEKTWRSLWEEVAGMTGTRWAVEIQSWRIIEEGEQSAWMGETATRLRFLCTRQE